MENKGCFGSFYEKAKPYIAMICLQFGYAGMNIIMKVSLNSGMSHYVLVVYRHAFATIAIAPFALIFERKVRPKITFRIFIQLFVLGLLGPVIDQNFYYMGLKYTSPTFSCAMSNMLPAMTFVMAVLCRMEILDMKKVRCQAKVIGTIVTVAGAMLMTLYKGDVVTMFWSKYIHLSSSPDSQTSQESGSDWLKGSILLILATFAWASFFILQAITLNKYTAQLSLTAIVCFLGTLQSIVVTLVMEHKPNAWAIGFDMNLMAAAYAGIVSSSIAYYVQGLEEKLNPFVMNDVAVTGCLEPPLAIPCRNHDPVTNELRQYEIVKSDQEYMNDVFPRNPHPWVFTVDPALQVVSVSIFKPEDHSHFSVVSGQITITDPNTNIKFYIYNGDKDILQPGWNDLLLTRDPLAFVMGGDIHFELTTEDATVPIFNHKYDMYKATPNFVNRRILTLQGDGNCGYGCKVLFTNTPLAAIAKVAAISVFPPPPQKFYPIHGKIQVNNIFCSEIKREEALKRKYKAKYDLHTCFPIQKALYVVPVDSPLTVDVELHCEDRVITKTTLELHAEAATAYPRFECQASGFAVRLGLVWYTPYDFFLNDLPLTSLPDCPRIHKTIGLPVSGALVEVFSVFFGGGKSAAPCDIDLYGDIVVTDGVGPFHILTGKDLPCKLPSSSSENDEQQFRTLALKWPDDRWAVGENFDMKFKLKDVKNNLLCWGLNSWFSEDSRYDMRLCDVIKGENGHFAALHYSVFQNGKKAKIYVQCSDGPYSIYGSVFAQYNNYDYSSTYEKQCCRSMLFRRSEERPLLAKGLQIPLLKSQVSAPSDCNELTVCFDLWVRPLSASFPHKRFTFNTNGTESRDIIWGSLMVKVEWICG